MSKITVRCVDSTRPEVDAALQRLAKACFREDYNRPPKGLHTAGLRWWLAYGAGQPIGLASAQLKAGRGWLRAGQGAFLANGGVVSGWRGNGVQQRLIQARLGWARRLGLGWAGSWTKAGNRWSANNLIACGFEQAGDGVGGVIYWVKDL